MANITIEFEYPLPDEYLHQTATKGLKAAWTYTGPEKIWVTVNKETGCLEWASGWTADNGTDELRDFMILMAGQARKAILVDASKDPLIASIFVDRRTSDQLPQKEYKIDGVTYYSRPEPTQPDHTFEVGEIYYDLDNNTWKKPFPWKKPHIDLDGLNVARMSIINGVEQDIANSETSAELKAKLVAFKAEMEAIPTKFAGWDAWQIPFPADPRAVPVEPTIPPPTVDPI